ncbi:MAG: four helix bundle protein [Planctomycetes bacterium]|nr:four helix bundle protein [Planctomycetota bacterium]
MVSGRGGVSMEEAKYSLDDFELYQAARAFRRKVYALSRQLPKEEDYVLRTQMRSAALSITNNIAEGHGRWHYQDNIRFCRIARGSVEEVLDDINTCLDEGYGDMAQNERLKAEGYALIARINGYIAYLRKSKQREDEA